MSDLKGLASACATSLALMALMIVPGLSMLPTIAKAQPLPGLVCEGGGVTGCFSCGPGGTQSGGKGCSGTTSPPAGWMVGFCTSIRVGTCTQGFINCGVWIDCMSGKPAGGNCATLTICI